MANIIITNICNLQCEYCFASTITNQEQEFIQLKDFCRILAFLGKSTNQRIGLIGGEPCLHPNFKNMLGILNTFYNDTGHASIVFSNGIFLAPYIPYLGNVDVLVNCNSPESQGEINYQQMLKSLQIAYDQGLIARDQVRCGCNIHLNQDDYSYFWNDIVDTFEAKIVRCSIVSPGGCYQKTWQHQDKKQEYYYQLKPKLMQFIQEANARNVKIAFDCNQIPVCFFDNEERELIRKVALTLPQLNCTPSVDIDMNLNAFSCFGVQGDSISITQFNTVDELERYLFINNTIPKIQSNGKGMCIDCDLYKKYQCQGGCLSFAEKETS